MIDRTRVFQGWFAAVMVVAVMVLPALAAGDDLPSAATLREAGLNDVIHAYVSTSGQSPQHVIQLDNNLELLLACDQPRSRAWIESAGIDVRDSQIELLQTWRLLEETDDGSLQTLLPILGESATNRLRERTRALATQLVDRHEADVKQFNEMLDERGWRASGFSLLFSLVLDGLVWDRFEARGVVETREITTARPLWAGAIWIIYPSRAFITGTNTISDAGVSMVTNWSPKALPKMAALVDFSKLGRLFEEITAGHERLSEKMIEIYEPYGIVDDEGRLLVAQLEASENDPGHASAMRLADAFSDDVVRLVSDDVLAEIITRGDASDRLIICYHELMWDILDELDRRGMIRIPPILKGEGDQRDVGSLVFITR